MKTMITWQNKNFFTSFVCRAHVLGEQAGDASVALWLSDRLAGTSAEAVVFDYVGFPSAILEDLRERIDLPVFDLGHLGLDALVAPPIGEVGDVEVAE